MKQLVVVFLLLINLSLFAQPLSTIHHYSSDDGLSQNTVMSILQDRKGYMWFATWNGLNRFDGYNFTSFKSRPGDMVSLSNNRIDQIVEDAQGYIWALAYDSKVHRFNTQTGQFINLQSDIKNMKGFPSAVARMVKLQNGSLWLLSNNEGAVKVTFKDRDDFTMQLYSTDNSMLASDEVNSVCADSRQNEWILTNNGLAQVRAQNPKTNLYFFESRETKTKNYQAFYSHCEVDNEIWFGSNNGRVWRYEFQGDKFQLLDLGCVSNVVDIKRIDDSKVVIATSNDGFFVYTKSSEKLEHFEKGRRPELPSNAIISAYVDRFGEVWFQQPFQGITHFVPKTGKLKYHPTQTEHDNLTLFHPAFFILEDKNNYLWVHPLGGGFSFYDREADKLKHFYNDPNDSDRMFSNMLHSVFTDQQGNLWMCTRSKGIEKVSFLDRQFEIFKPEPQRREPLSNDVRALLQDKDKNFWVATKDGILRLFDSKRNYLGFVTQQGQVAKIGKPFDGVTYTILHDKQNNIWIGTKGNGLFKATQQSANPLSYKLSHYRSSVDDIYSLSNDNVYHLHEDAKGRIWVATYGGGINFIEPGANGFIRFINHRNNLKGYPSNSCFRVRYIASGPNEDLILGTTNGLVVFNSDFVNPESVGFKQFTFESNDSTCLSSNDVHSIYVTGKREVYVATFGGGLNKMEIEQGTGKTRFKSFTTLNGLSSDVLLALLEDNNGNLWLTTENGISKFNIDSQTFENYDERNFGRKVLLSESTAMRDDKGYLWFGTDHGIINFDPSNIHKSTFVPSIVLTDLLLFNKKVVPSEQSNVLTKHIDDIDRLVLTHRHNVVSIAYSALDMKYPEKVKYAIKLDGFDTDWKYVQNQRIATYTNLAHGNYVLRIKSTNSDGVWVDNERSLAIKILPSFWVTGWAYLIYFLIFVFIVGSSVYVLFVIYHLKNRVTIEHQLTELKLRFFTDISHELRTPLTLISAPIEHILQQPDLPAHTRDELKLVERNSDRMLRLINQILDFVKIQNRKMELRVEEIEIGSMVARIMENFKSLAADHQIDFKLDDRTNGEVVYLDVDKFEKIVFNLLSNAFKFTGVGKSISVILENRKESVVLRVKDSGVGISEGKKKALFGRFESFIDRNLFNQPSTGIGLSLVKELVDMHKAKIEVDSILGEGTIFSIEFYKGIGHFDNDTDIIVPENVESSAVDLQQDASLNDDDDSSNTCILLVEDNDEMRQFLKNILAKNYRILEAVNGHEGLEIASANIPDLIISDVMMEGMDGLQMLRSLRNQVQTSHIPCILLTAKTSIESKLEGLETGADDYITKPFSTTYLLARVENLLDQRRKLQELYRSSLGVGPISVSPSKPQIHSHDQKFMDDLTLLMENNMDNGSLVVDDLVSQMGVSRSVFFKKLKTLTGLAPIEFIKEMRVKRAAQLMESGQFNMTQISYMVGINDPRYFSKCFKQFFGVTPTEYKDRLKGA